MKVYGARKIMCVFMVSLLVLVPFTSFPASTKGGSSSSKDLSKSATEELEKEFEQKQQQIDQIIESKAKISYKYKHMEYNSADHTYTLWGDVEIEKQDVKFKAQKATYNDWTEEFELEEDVEIYFKEDFLSGTRAIYNYKTQTGYLENASGELTPHVIFEGDLLEILPTDPDTGKGVYRIINGMFTSCEGDGRVPWRIQCVEATAHRDNYLQLSHPRFKVMEVPIFWVPYWIHPIKPDRSTGFLFPEISRNSRLGMHFMPAFFWAINDQVDTTFTLNYYSDFILEQKTQLRYAVSQLSQGDIDIFLRKEKVDQIDGDLTSDSFGVEMDYEIRHALPGGFRLKGTGDLFTEEISEQFLYDRGLSERYMKNIQSYASISKIWGGKNYFSLNFSDTKEVSETGRRRQTLPDTYYSRAYTEIFHPNLQYSFNVRMTHGRTLYNDELTETESLTTVHMQPSLRYNWNIAPWLIMVPELNLLEDYFSDREPVYLSPDFPVSESSFGGTKHIGDGLLRSTLRLESKLTGPIFYRNFEGLYPMGLNKLQHTLEPEISFSFVPDFNQYELLQNQRLVPTKTLGFKLTNRLMGKKDKGSGVELAAIELSTGFDYWKEDNLDLLEQLHEQNPDKYGEPDRYKKPWNDIALGLRFSTPSKRLTVYGSIAWDPYFGGIENTRFTFGADQNRWTTYFNWTRFKSFSLPDEPVSNSFSISGYYDVAKSFQFQTEAVITVQDLEPTTGQAHFACKYMPSCWGINLFIDRYIGDTLPQNSVNDVYEYGDYWNIGFSFELRNVGTVQPPGFDSYRIE